MHRALQTATSLLGPVPRAKGEAGLHKATLVWDAGLLN